MRLRLSTGGHGYQSRLMETETAGSRHTCSAASSRFGLLSPSAKVLRSRLEFSSYKFPR